ncbi:hypothetical protein T484DRAFT_1792059 [Baffinella frigidus]|nr:hypothetical protein T484DRAFT_1792059 [Cryptophyta sp. CCMP2293]
MGAKLPGSVGHKIAAGAFGTVWDAKIVTSGATGVVKVQFPDRDLDGAEACRSHPPPDWVVKESFAREIQLLSAIDHPNVVKMLGATLTLPLHPSCIVSLPYPTLERPCLST